MEPRNTYIGLFYFAIALSVLFFVYLIYADLIFQPHNLILSSVITVLLVSSIISLVALLHRLLDEDLAIDSAKKKSLNSIEDVNELVKRLKESLIKERLLNVSKVYELSNSVNYDEIEYLTQCKQRNFGELARYFVGGSILIGWIGTFLGILLSVKSVNSKIDSSNLDELIGGFYLSIGASILGIFTSLLLGFLYTLYKAYENTVFAKLEEVSILKIIPLFTGTGNNHISRAIIESMNRVLPEIVRESTENLIVATQNLRETATEIASHQQSISRLVEQINTAIVDGSRNNGRLQQLLVGFNEEISRVSPALDRINETIDENSREFGQLSVEHRASQEILNGIYISLRASSTAIESFSTNVKREFGSIVQETSNSNRQLSTAVKESVSLLTNGQTQTNKTIVEIHTKLMGVLTRIETNPIRLRSMSFWERVTWLIKGGG